MGLYDLNTTGLCAENRRNNNRISHVDNPWEILPNPLLPHICASCKRLGHIICSACYKIINEKCLLDFPLCLVCEKLCLSGNTHKACAQSTMVERFFCTYLYAYAVRNILKGKAKNIGAIRALLLSPENQKILREIPKVNLVVPMPPTYKILKPRLVEPTLIISRYISEWAQTNTANILYKNILTKPQKELDSKHRTLTKLYLKRDALNEIANRTILLVDDICTTGSTLNSAAKLLTRFGAGRIFAYTLARDLRYNMQ